MLFLNNHTRSRAISGIGLHDGSYTHKVGHSCIIGGCLSVVTGLILIVVGVISEGRKTTFIGVGIISLGVGFFLSTLVCFYAKLDICYNNWAYRSRVLPKNLETPQPVPPGIVIASPFASPSTTAEKQQTSTLPGIPTPITIGSDPEIREAVEDSCIKADSIARHSAHVP